jgi:putative oxidoreductase
VQTAVDIAFHGSAAGVLFNTRPLELLDHRVLWLFPLLVLLVHGPGRVSLDAWLRGRLRG